MTHDTGWFKSSRSSGGSNACVEVRFADDVVRVRDSKNPDGPAFSFRADAWAAFLSRVGR
ncbi:DUF397 domain-containing protein [Saccharothrix obliqua]|uniref:DUF397 domain-containing protein n=1 Tax=Saccharothrix obliqua TaxID=2861747 RepID=UPI001C608056|nr:DUF397 domain-containing protein [Saccharothrix obliqua]MBW4715551.1 DUF397 domain-containing protein [Saccharothrix obliqua]